MFDSCRVRFPTHQQNQTSPYLKNNINLTVRWETHPTESKCKKF